MPIYKYECRECEHDFTHLKLTTSEPEPECPECGAEDPARRLSAPTLKFKGTGFYCTDYQDK